MAHFYFQARQNNSRVQLIQSGSSSTVSLEYSYDESNWSIWYKDTTLSSGQTLYLRGDNPDGYYTDANNFNRFTATGEIEIGGDIRSLVDVTMASSIVPCSVCFYTLFRNCTSLVSVSSDLLSGFTTLTNSCYENMFSGCTSLTTAPELPATTLAYSCYGQMFYGCTSLTTAPELPATTLANECYYKMFFGCTSLTSTPTLPATTLTSHCYRAMFYNCTSLTTAPALPATTLAQNCYYEMFAGCINLVNPPTISAATTSNSSCAYMFLNCTSLVNAPSLPATTLDGGCYIGMFWGCTGLTSAPSLPATTLTESCYSSMFKNCTSLQVAPVLSATTLADYCYAAMFEGCTSLTTAPALPTTTLTKECYRQMFKGCAGLTNTPVLAATTLANGCYKEMFYGCTSLTTAPALPATTMAGNCYQGMFFGCTSLTTAPVLPSTTLVGECYRTMFEDCTSLNYIKCLATNISAGNCTYNWVRNVSPTGTFVKDAAMNDWTTGDSGIPSGWTVYDDGPGSITPSETSYTGLSYESVSTQRPYVTYFNIVLSSVTATCAADWVDLDWVDSSTKAQLEISIDDNDTNLSRTATVMISGRDYQNQSHTATITLQQDGRPSGAIIVVPNKTIPWSYDGKIFIEVAYSGFTSIGDVSFSTGGTGDFIYDIDWTDDETKTELWIKVNDNDTISARIQTITLTGTDDWDNVITATITVTQSAYNRFPIWQDVYYTGSTTTLDYYIVMDNTDIIYQGRAYVQPNQDNVKINISKICQNYLDNDIEDGNEFIDGLGFLTYGNNAVRTFSLYNASGDTLLEEYTYFYNWSYNALSNNLVLTTPINGHADSRMVKVCTDVMLEDSLYFNHTKGSLYTNGYCGDYALYYLQRNGGWAAFLIEANSKKTDNYEKYFYNMAFDNNRAMFEKNIYHNQITSSWELHTGWLTDEQAQNLAFNLLSSNRVFLHDFKANKVIPVVLTNNEAEYKTFKNNGRNLINFTITAEESQRKQLI